MAANHQSAIGQHLNAVIPQSTGALTADVIAGDFS